MARSFRSGSLKALITHGESSSTVFGEVSTEAGTLRALGVSRALDGGVNLRIAGEAVRSVAMLADELPLLLINAESFELLTGQPVQRRRFLDWGVFHVEHGFMGWWRQARDCLKQRNSVLRHGKISVRIGVNSLCVGLQKQEVGKVRSEKAGRQEVRRLEGCVTIKRQPYSIQYALS